MSKEIELMNHFRTLASKILAGLVLSQFLIQFASAYDFVAARYPQHRWIESIGVGDLSPEQKRQIQEGKPVTILQEVQGAPWPKVSIFKTVAATPEEAAAVFWDVERHKEFLPDIKQSAIVNREGPLTIDVNYYLDLPWPFGHEQYVTRSVLSRSAGNPNLYETHWKQVRADTLRDIQGFFRAEPFGPISLMVYHNFVVPGSAAAGKMRKRAVQGIFNAAISIQRRVEQEKRENPQLLALQVQAMRQALTQERFRREWYRRNHPF